MTSIPIITKVDSFLGIDPIQKEKSYSLLKPPITGTIWKSALSIKNPLLRITACVAVLVTTPLTYIADIAFGRVVISYQNKHITDANRERETNRAEKYKHALITYVCPGAIFIVAIPTLWHILAGDNLIGNIVKSIFSISFSFFSFSIVKDLCYTTFSVVSTIENTIYTAVRIII